MSRVIPFVSFRKPGLFRGLLELNLAGEEYTGTSTPCISILVIFSVTNRDGKGTKFSTSSFIH